MKLNSLKDHALQTESEGGGGVAAGGSEDGHGGGGSSGEQGAVADNTQPPAEPDADDENESQPTVNTNGVLDAKKSRSDFNERELKMAGVAEAFLRVRGQIGPNDTVQSMEGVAGSQAYNGNKFTYLVQTGADETERRIEFYENNNGEIIVLPEN